MHGVVQLPSILRHHTTCLELYFRHDSPRKSAACHCDPRFSSIWACPAPVLHGRWLVQRPSIGQSGSLLALLAATTSARAGYFTAVQDHGGQSND
ncbi:hypothetical protein VTI28DRAFT_4836 [Corynascus sepedonium]